MRLVNNKAERENFHAMNKFRIHEGNSLGRDVWAEKEIQCFLII